MICSHVHDVNRPLGQKGSLISFDILETQVWLWRIPLSSGNTSLGSVGPTSYTENPEVKRSICAILAGYVWDKNNPFVLKHDRVVKNLAHLIRMSKQEKSI
ncbi:hypothetical protein ACLCDV_09590 [Sphingobacterium sp. Lzh-3]|uniref:hypothetical protein n=1 Tax=unclassified Sphingobacterium TaxID=2609468 RepID=UPI002952F482|nr:hypothetical protein [Sphingobacterium sp. UGAL515B_05]WON94474.1 hypothetical protein OK025_24925 [Sphingobacterium sp. UGAL515B_05]